MNPIKTIEKLQKEYRDKTSTPSKTANDYLTRISGKNLSIGAFLSVHPEYAMGACASLELQNISRQPLYGIPIAIKDNIQVKGLPCTAASKILEGYIAPYESTVVEKIIKAGGIILGKTNMDEFAMGSSTENSGYYPTRNPFNLDFVPGGSSGGSTAAVAADLSTLALGSDTGGSIRQPASFCSVVGIRPTYGLVSRFGLIAFASSLDQIGPIASTVEDAFLLLSVIAGHDPKDAMSLPFEYENLPLNKSITSFAIIEEIENLTLDPSILERYKFLKKKLSYLYQCKTKNVKNFKYALPTYHVIAGSEASSNLSRFDGIRFGARVDCETWKDTIEETRTSGFGPEVKRRILLGTFTLSAGYKSAYYAKAFLARKSIINEFTEIFKEVDFILTPTTTTLPFRFGSKIDPLQMYMSDICTIPAALAGLPAVSIPFGFSENGLPIGMQIIGSHCSDRDLHQIAKIIESFQNE
jgi:aspartyl-tRNA(Asn)/glutamyl-tRNA(Gln) amidotransferase subunit A